MWDFVTTMVNAGATLQSKGQLSASSQAAYTSLLNVLKESISASDVEAFIANPSDDLRQQLLLRDMAALEPSQAQPIIHQAEVFKQQLEATDKGLLEGLSVRFDGAKMQNLRVQNNEVEEGGMQVSASYATIQGDVEISGNTVGSTKKSTPKRI